MPRRDSPLGFPFSSDPNLPTPQTEPVGNSSFAPDTDAPEPHPQPVLLTVPEVAAWLRTSEKTVRRRIKSGLIRVAPTGGRLVRISSDELRRLTAGNPPEAP